MEIIPQIILYGTIILTTSWFGRPIWFLVQGIQLLGLGVLFVSSPSFTFDTFMHMMIGEYDHLNDIIIRSMAIWYFSQGFMVLYYRNSTDNRFVCALLQSQIVAYYLETVSHIPHFGMGNMSPTILHFPDKGAVYPAFLCLGNLVQFLMMSKPREATTCQTSSINERIDGVGMLILGASVFAYSKQIMSFMTNRTDFYCDSLVPAAALGAYMIYCGLFSLQSDIFEKIEYKRTVYWTRIAECLLLMALVAYYWIFSDLFNSNIVWACLVLVMFLCNTGLALMNSAAKIKV